MTNFEVRPQVPPESDPTDSVAPASAPPVPAYPPAGPPGYAYPPPGYAYPPPGHVYPPPPYGYVVAPSYNTYAILAVVFAFAVFAPLGIFFGYKARDQIARTGERGIELAKVGIIGGWVLTCVQGAFLIVWCGLFFSMATQFGRFS